MKVIEEHIKSLIQDIITEIGTRHIDILAFCDKIALKPEELLDLINNPVNNVSLYVEILEEVRNERD